MDIIKFSDFKIEKQEPVNEGLGDYILKGLSMVGDGFADVIKQKIVAHVLEYLGIKEQSPLSKVIQEVFEKIEFSEYYGIVTGKYTNWDFFIPKIAEGIVSFLMTRESFDGIAEWAGIESDGYLYSTLREMLEERLMKGKDFKLEIEKFLKSMLKGSPGDNMVLKDVIEEMNPLDRNKALDKIKKIGKKAGIDKLSGAKGQEGEVNLVSDFIKMLVDKTGDGASELIKSFR